MSSSKEVVHVQVEAVRTVAPVEGNAVFDRQDEVAVHHDFDTESGTHVGRLPFATVYRLADVVRDGSVVPDGLQLLCPERTGDDTQVEKGIRGDVPLLAEKSEIEEPEPQFRVGPGHAIAYDAVVEDSPQGDGSAEDVGVDLLQEERGVVLLYVEGGPAGYRSLPA